MTNFEQSLIYSCLVFLVHSSYVYFFHNICHLIFEIFCLRLEPVVLNLICILDYFWDVFRLILYSSSCLILGLFSLKNWINASKLIQFFLNVELICLLLLWIYESLEVIEWLTLNPSMFWSRNDHAMLFDLPDVIDVSAFSFAGFELDHDSAVESVLLSYSTIFVAIILSFESWISFLPIIKIHLKQVIIFVKLYVCVNAGSISFDMSFSQLLTNPVANHLVNNLNSTHFFILLLSKWKESKIYGLPCRNHIKLTHLF